MINDGELFSKVSECIISVDKFPSKPYAQEDGIMEGRRNEEMVVLVISSSDYIRISTNLIVFPSSVIS